MNNKKRIYLSSPHMSGIELEYVKEAFETNWIAPLGPHVDAFEQEMADYVGANGSVALSSGTAAIHLALKLLGIRPGDVIFCSSLTFAASCNPILYENGEPVFIDSEPISWNMSPIALEKAFKDAKKKRKIPKAVIVVNLYGQSADFEPIIDICNKYSVPVIEDAAESLGATYKGKASGTWGQFGIYSFNGNKIITTSGGGMLVSDDVEALDKARFWASQARDQAKHYQHSEIGYNYRMSNICAGIGRGQLKVLEERVRVKREIFNRYNEELSTIDGIKFMPEPTYGRSNRWLTTLTLDSEKCRITPNRLMDELAIENIESRPVWKPMHLQPLYKDYKYYSHYEHESVSEYLFNNGVCLPSGTNMNEEDLSRVISYVKMALDKY